jgi:Protein of unknown function (DUF1189)
MEFFRVIRSSLYDPAFYDRVRGQVRLGPAIKIFGILSIVGIGLTMAIVYVGLVPFAYSNFPDAVESAYPDDLVVTIAHGEMSVNQPQPYYVQNTLPGLSDQNGPKYLAIFDGNDVLSGDLQQNSTFMLVKKAYAITPGNNDQEQVVSFANIQSTTTVQKSTVVGVIEKLRPYFRPVVLFGGALLFIILTLIGSVFWVVFHMIYVLIPAVLVFLFGQIRGSGMRFWESYMIALYASIPVAILFYLLSRLGVTQPGYAYTLALLLVAVVNISRGRSGNTVPADTSGGTITAVT